MDSTVENFVEIHSICDSNYYVPSAIQLVENLNEFAIGLLSVGSILSILTFYLAVDTCHNVLSQKDSRFFKSNVIMIMSVYPVASVCSFTAIAIPRGQLLSEAVTQMFLTTALYRLYHLLLDVGRRKINETPTLILRVGPCCCWPCLPFPDVRMTDSHLSWLKILILQLPIVQGLLFCIFLFMAAENTTLADQYMIYFQPIMVTSILLGIYSLTVATKTLHKVAPEAKLHFKTLVLQLVLLFSKLQLGIIRSLSSLFPCNPPISPAVYANVTFNALMLLEMLLLCYVARRIYYVDLDKNQESDAATDQTRTSTDNSANGANKQLPSTIA
ncbi:organic solute transporter alpha-like protein [Pseudomyrmex gracilis]|uniref:organic solute transporter alpha-like protein n=1 Tax=Pseudomyrmex gracilis TaxID=219809 RepID=UPI0009949E87|nr:organic solute transporter alpha-like protein [Pseudomyrmex gracilis]